MRNRQWAEMRRQVLKDRLPDRYEAMLKAGTLEEHLQQVQENMEADLEAHGATTTLDGIGEVILQNWVFSGCTDEDEMARSIAAKDPFQP